MSIARVCTPARCRWKMLLWLLLMLVVLLNAVIFVGVPGGSKIRSISHGLHVKVAGRHRSDVSHLQIMRKGLDKSTANNSSSLHYVEWDGKGIVNSDPGAGNEHQDQHQKSKHYQFGERTQELISVAKKRLGLGRFGHMKNLDNDKDIEEEDEDEEEENNNEYPNDAVVDHRDGVDVGGETSKDEAFGEADKSHSSGGKATRNYTLAQVDQLVKAFMSRYEGSPFVSDDQTKYDQFLYNIGRGMKWGPRLQAFVNYKGKKSWEHFHHGIRQHALYDPYDPYLQKLIGDLQTRPIVNVEQKEGGTQIKLMVTCEDEGQALFKPMRFPRNQETLPDHFYFADYERHNAEIAAFHLDRVLGFYRVPPTIGRWVNISHDIHRVSNAKLAKTFFISPVGNWCFHGSCSYYCDSSHPICGHPIMLEGSMAAFLPPLQMAKRKTWRNPWKRSYSKHRKAYWEVYDDLCLKVKQKHPYNEGRRLMDVLDMSVFDFLTGNLDRHHYETFREFGNNTFLLHMDNGRAFGKPRYDCISCLAPVRQCCMIRQSTLAKLVKFYQGPQSLSQIMRSSLATDRLNPILLEPHLDALDRRVSKILHVIQGCLQDGGGRSWSDVVIDDGVT